MHFPMLSEENDPFIEPPVPSFQVLASQNLDNIFNFNTENDSQTVEIQIKTEQSSTKGQTFTDWEHISPSIEQILPQTQ